MNMDLKKWKTPVFGWDSGITTVSAFPELIFNVIPTTIPSGFLME